MTKDLSEFKPIGWLSNYGDGLEFHPYKEKDMDEQLPLFELATEPSCISDAGVLIAPAIDPLSETEDVPAAPNHFISWDELQERWGYTPEQFAQADTTTMSPIEDEELTG